MPFKGQVCGCVSPNEGETQCEKRNHARVGFGSPLAILLASSANAIAMPRACLSGSGSGGHAIGLRLKGHTRGMIFLPPPCMSCLRTILLIRELNTCA